MIRYEHKHTYVYQFELQKHKSHSYGFQKCEYTLLTTDPNCKANRQLLESMLRTVYGHMPKGVKFSYEKVK